MKILHDNFTNFGKSITTTVGNLHGLHFAPSAAIAEITRKIGKPVYFSHAKDTFKKDIKGSMVGIAMMEFAKDDKIVIDVADDYPDYALNAIKNCIEAWNNEGLDYIKKAFFKQYYEKIK